MTANSQMGGLLLLFTLAPLGHAASQAYIDAVKADYAEFASGNFQPPADLAWTGKTPNASDGTTSLADFGNFVKRQFRGTYILYSRLPESQKYAIWREYLKTGDLGGIRSNIYAARRHKSRFKKPERHRSSITNLPIDF